MPVFVNRVLNLKHIKVVGFDMDYTLVRYHTEAFEELTHQLACKRLVEKKKYPEQVLNLVFDPKRSISGLVVDKKNGNLIKLSRFGKVKSSYHGLEEIDYRTQATLYREMAIDLSDPDFRSLDTAFAVSNGVLFSQLVHLKSEGIELPDYAQIYNDTDWAIDSVHKDGSLKDIVKADFPRYVIQDPEVAYLLERYKDYGKRLMIITNSDFNYTRALLDYTLNPFWKKHNSWQEVFDVVITFADKPSFFEKGGRFLKIDPESGLMSNWNGKVNIGIYQGGCFQQLEDDLGVFGSEILYIGDHIYGDVVSIKKRCNWRTALVLAELQTDLEGIKASRPLQKKINKMMDEKRKIEHEINQMSIRRYEGKKTDKRKLDVQYERLDVINGKISTYLDEYRSYFNPYWGEILRAGNEESRLADQLERYACIYMTKVSDLYEHSPKTYFRPIRRIMAHEILDEY